jgi:acid phosphatase type 7
MSLRSARLRALPPLVLIATLLPASSAPADRAIFPAAADAFVSARSPTANHGTRKTLRIAGRRVMRGYLRFDVALPRGAVVTAARLRLSAASRGRAVRYRAYAVRNTRWRERSITYRSAPRFGALLGTSTGSRTTRFRSVRIPAAAVRPGRLSIGLATASGRRLRVWSRHASRKPELAVSYAPGPATAPGSALTPVGGAGAAAEPGGTPAGRRAVVLAAGDIQSAGTTMNATAPLLGAHAFDALLTLGDNQYESGALADYTAFYGRTWGAPPYKSRTYPAPGNHEMGSDVLANYCAYFRDAAAPAAVDPCPGGRPYYSFDLGDWHLISLDSSPGTIDATQRAWLRADLAAHPARCTLAYWHHPRYSGGTHGHAALNGVWDDLMAGGVDVVLAGHDHNYQRFAPMDDAGRIDPARGIRSFVVGTGGRGHYAVSATTGQEVANADTFGVLQLTLDPGGYAWRFLPEPGRAFTDAGAETCR